MKKERDLKTVIGNIIKVEDSICENIDKIIPDALENVECFLNKVSEEYGVKYENVAEDDLIKNILFNILQIRFIRQIIPLHEQKEYVEKFLYGLTSILVEECPIRVHRRTFRWMTI